MNDNNDKNNEIVWELANEVYDIIEKYSPGLPPYEIGHQLISNAVRMLLSTAPNHLVGIKTVFACVENGIISYEENHACK